MVEIDSINTAAYLCTNTKFPSEYKASFQIYIGEQAFQVRDIHINDRKMTCYFEQGWAVYTVHTNGDLSLFDYTLEGL